MFDSKPTIRIIADFLSPSGYAKAAIDYVLALDRAGFNVIPTFPKSTWGGTDLNPDIFATLIRLSKNKSSGDEIVIEEMVPELMSNNKNYAFCVWETTKIPQSWVQILNNKLGVITCSSFSKDSMINAGVNVPIFVVPHAVELNDTNFILKLNSKKRKILTVGDFTERKNLDSIIKGYLIACNKNKDVELIIKTCTLNPLKSGMKFKSMVNKSVNSAIDYLKSIGEEIDLPEIYIIDKILEDRYMQHLYKNADIYISASLGEAFNLPLAEAMYYGLPVICPEIGGHREFVNENSAILMGGEFRKAGGVEGNGRYDNAGEWFYVNHLTIASAIKYAFSNDLSTIALSGKNDVKSSLSYKSIANKYSEVINKIYNPIMFLKTPKSISKKNDKPFVVKCVQVLNEEKLVKANLRNLYDKVDLILLVEGAAIGRKDQLNGHSIDSTIKKIEEFILEEDKEGKILFMTKKNGFENYEDIKNMFSFIMNNHLSEIDNKICYIADADEFMTNKDFDKIIETFELNPECSEVVPKFIHYYDNLSIIQRPIPSKMNILHQRFTRWQKDGMWYFNHPTLTSLRDRVDTACHPTYQNKRLVVDAYIHHTGDIKDAEFYKMKHEYYNKELNGHYNLDFEWKCNRDFPSDRLMYYNGVVPKELINIYSTEDNVLCLPIWTDSNAYNSLIKLKPLFTGMEDKEFI